MRLPQLGIADQDDGLSLTDVAATGQWNDTLLVGTGGAGEVETGPLVSASETVADESVGAKGFSELAGC